MSPESATPLSLEGVSTLAGVSRAAVSNWRARRPDFPAPINPGERRPLFAPEEIHQFLAEHAARKRDGSPGDHITTEFAQAPLEDVIIVGALLRVRQLDHDLPATKGAIVALLRQLSTTHAELGADVLRTAGSVSRARLGELATAAESLEPSHYDRVVRARAAGTARHNHSVQTHTDLVDVLLDAAGPLRGRTILDPTAGSGQLLLEAGRRADDAALFGQELEARWTAVARLRIALAGVVGARLETGNTVKSSAFPDLRADLVITDPPVGLRLSDPAPPEDPRWSAGQPTLNADTVWLQHAVHHLADDGRALVALGASSLVAADVGQVRGGLLGLGCVEAVVMLSPGLVAGVGAGLALWVLARPDPSRQDVLLVDATDEDARGLGESIYETLTALRAARPLPLGLRAALVGKQVLLQHEADLTPRRWTSDPRFGQRTSPFEQAESEWARARGAFDALSTLMSHQPSTGTAAAEARSLEELQQRGDVSLVPGVRGRNRVKGPAVTANDLRRDSAPARTANGPSGDPLTQPGDVLLVTEGSELFARVADASWAGLVPVFPVHVVRPTSDSFTADYLAAVLTSERNQARLRGSVVLRARAAELLVPDLSPAAQQALGASVDVARQIAEQAAAMQQAALAAGAAVADSVFPSVSHREEPS